MIEAYLDCVHTINFDDLLPICTIYYSATGDVVSFSYKTLYTKSKSQSKSLAAVLDEKVC